MIFHDVQQNSDEWDILRVGKTTTSKFGVVMANYGKVFSEPAQKYAFKIAKEQVTGVKSNEESYTNSFMDAGHEWEPIARLEYEAFTFNTVSNGGFCQHDTKLNIGGSPDGLVGYKGGVEIKSVIDWTQRKTIKRGSFDPAYRWQLLGNIWLCDLDWIDFVSYGYNYTEGKRLFIDRLEKDAYQEQIDMIEPRINDFQDLIEKEKKYL